MRIRDQFLTGLLLTVLVLLATAAAGAQAGFPYARPYIRAPVPRPQVVIVCESATWTPAASYGWPVGNSFWHANGQYHLMTRGRVGASAGLLEWCGRKYSARACCSSAPRPCQAGPYFSSTLPARAAASWMLRLSSRMVNSCGSLSAWEPCAQRRGTDGMMITG